MLHSAFCEASMLSTFWKYKKKSNLCTQTVWVNQHSNSNHPFKSEGCEFIYSGRHTYIHFITLSLFVIYNMQCIRRNGIREKSNNACRVPPLIYINRATGRQSMPTIIDAYIMTSSTSSMSKNTLSIALRDHEINSILQVGLTFLLSCVP